MLTVTHAESRFTLTEAESVHLELKLNVTSKGKEWASIGDHLFAYGTRKTVSEVLTVNYDQFAFLSLLMTKQWKDCRDL